MKQITVTQISIILCLLLSGSIALSRDSYAEEIHKGERRITAISPEIVIENYFTALQSGDTAEIRNILGGELLQKRNRLLSNPTYPYTLQNWYRDATFSITGIYIIDTNKVNVEAVVSNLNTQQVKYSFLLEQDTSGVFHITGETEIL